MTECGSDFRDNFYIVLIVCSSVSIVGCVILIGLFALNLNLRNIFNKIVLYSTISDLLRCIILMIPCHKVKSQGLIVLLGVIYESTLVIPIAWSACISITMYQVIILNHPNPEKYNIYWIIGTFIFVPLLYLLPETTNSYTVELNICIIELEGKGYIWRIATIYVPVLLLFSLSIFTYLRVYLLVRNSDIEVTLKILVRRTSLYIFTMACDIIPIITARLYQLFYNNCDGEWIFAVSLCVFSLHGTLNFIVFSLNNSVRIFINSSFKFNRLPSARKTINYSSTSSPNLLNCTIESILTPL